MKTDLSHSDLQLMLDIIHAALKCQSKEAFLEVIDVIKNLLNFSYLRSLYGDSDEYATKKMDAFKMITAFPKEWETRYNEKDYFIFDNIARTAFQKDGLFYWADYAERKDADDTINKKSKAIMAEAATVGLKHGWLYSMYGRKSSACAILSMAGDQFEKTERTRSILDYVAPHLCLAIIRIMHGPKEVSGRLSQREGEVLSWIAKGKTAWETSVILNISSRTVEFHMGNILKKLDAVNSQQAIAIALSLGMIEY